MKKNANIMESSIKDLLEILSHFMAEFDDAIEPAKDLGKDKVAEHVNESINELDALYHKFKNENKASEKDRNKARLTIKYTTKLIVSELVIPTDYV